MPNFGWIRNPLSVVALFISLIYGMSASLFSYSVSSLTRENQTILVWFIVLFPVAVLCVFAWLVAKHHLKLYGPGDFRSDDSFVSTFRSATTKEILEKREAEVKEQISPPQPGVTINVPAAIVDLKKEASTTDILETLAIKKFAETVLDSILHMQLKIKDAILDAVLETPSKFIVVEVKVLQNNRYLFTALQQGSRTLQRAKELMRPFGRSIETVLIVVFVKVPTSLDFVADFERIPPGERPDRLRQYSSEELLGLAVSNLVNDSG
ncbi:hypothetical protein [Bradyrhizobium oligotrophicum]|uniref:hypothetical protein n=1 Tax=Bradyrhizobium oligotrophicum TaxID=44255 RepID=UPI003EBBA941